MSVIPTSKHHVSTGHPIIEETTNKEFYLEDGMSASFLGRPGSLSPQTGKYTKIEESTDQLLINSIRLRKLTKGRDLDKVDNKTLVNSLSAV